MGVRSLLSLVTDIDMLNATGDESGETPDGASDSGVKEKNTGPENGVRILNSMVEMTGVEHNFYISSPITQIHLLWLAVYVFKRFRGNNFTSNHL